MMSLLHCSTIVECCRMNWCYQAARQTMAQDEMSSEPRPIPVNISDDDHAKIQSYEEAFRQIKEATGVSDTQASLLLPVFRSYVTAYKSNSA